MESPSISIETTNSEQPLDGGARDSYSECYLLVSTPVSLLHVFIIVDTTPIPTTSLVVDEESFQSKNLNEPAKGSNNPANDCYSAFPSGFVLNKDCREYKLLLTVY